MPSEREWRDGETLTVDDHNFQIVIEYDDFHEAPWEEYDSFGDVSEWTTRYKEPGELILHTDRSSKRYYDFAGGVRKARTEGFKSRKAAADAVRAEYERFRAWCNDQWSYVVLFVRMVDDDGNEIPLASPNTSIDTLGGVESDYWKDAALDIIAGLVADFDNEQREREFAQSLGVPTR